MIDLENIDCGNLVKNVVQRFGLHFSSDRYHLLNHMTQILSHFPYENLSKIIKHHQYGIPEKKIRLPEEVLEDHLRFKLGGTCFSLTYFLDRILKELGFDSYIVMADMQHGKNIHCAEIVMINDNKYLIDPGYLFHNPILIEPGRVKHVRTAFTYLRSDYSAAEKTGDIYTFEKVNFKWRYRFFDKPVSMDDFYKHWINSFDMNGMRGFCLNKLDHDEMIYLHKHFMRVTSFGNKKNHSIKQNYHAVIQERFGISPEIIEQAGESLTANLKRERESSLWVPKKSGSIY